MCRINLEIWRARLSILLSSEGNPGHDNGGKTAQFLTFFENHPEVDIVTFQGGSTPAKGTDR